MPRPEDFNVDELIEDLVGTCKSLNDGVSDLAPDMDETDLTSADHDKIDSQIFHCAECGWWCEIDEATEEEGGDQYCRDCRPDDED